MFVRYPHLSLGTHRVLKGFFIEKAEKTTLNVQEASGDLDGYIWWIVNVTELEIEKDKKLKKKKTQKMYDKSCGKYKLPSEKK